MAVKRINQANMQVKQDMFDALMALLQDNDFSTISISDLTTRANVSRMAFYRNYNSMEDILKSKLSEIVKEYENEEITPENGDHYNDKKYMIHCFSFLKEHHDFLDVLLNTGMGDLFLSEITNILNSKWNKEDNPTIRYEMCAFAGSIYNMYREWNRKEFCDSPDDLAELLCSINII